MVQEQEVDHSLWDGLLRRHVIQDTVDYEGFRAEADVLEQYLTIIREATAAQLPLQEAKLAYWINAYNATVVQAVLDQGPLQSVKDVGGFFDRTRHPVNREELTLDEIEARGRALGDWRIHFAVVCASSSCPVLRAEAYAADRLEDQLADQTRVFLADSSRGLGLEGKTLWVSKIFQWYTGDFVPAKELGIFKRLTAERLLAVIKPYVPKDLVLEGRRLTLQFMEYDWTLNAHASP